MGIFALQSAGAGPRSGQTPAQVPLQGHHPPAQQDVAEDGAGGARRSLPGSRRLRCAAGPTGLLLESTRRGARRRRVSVGQ